MAFGAVEHSWMQEVRPSTIMAQDPQTFVRQHVAPLLYERTEGQAFGVSGITSWFGFASSDSEGK